MKIPIIIKGLHYATVDKHFLKGYKIDFRKHIDSFFKNIHAPLIEQGHQVDILLATEDSPIKEELSLYKPIAFLFDSDVGSCYFKTPIGNLYSIDFMKRIAHAQNYIKENHLEYDSILVTRFDLHMYTMITSLNIDLTKCCFYCQCSELDEWNDDNLFIVPQDKFLMLEDHLHVALHELKRKIPNFTDYQFMVPERYEIGRGVPDYQLGWMIDAGWPIGEIFHPL